MNLTVIKTKHSIFHRALAFSFSLALAHTIKMHCRVFKHHGLIKIDCVILTSEQLYDAKRIDRVFVCVCTSTSDILDDTLRQWTLFSIPFYLARLFISSVRCNNNETVFHYFIQVQHLTQVIIYTVANWLHSIRMCAYAVATMSFFYCTNCNSSDCFRGTKERHLTWNELSSSSPSNSPIGDVWATWWPAVLCPEVPGYRHPHPLDHMIAKTNC